MIQYLHRLKAKKGFTLVELIVVLAIMAVIITILMVNMIGGNSDKQLSGNSNAAAFFTAAQLTFTRAQMTEMELVQYEPSDTKFIEYKSGKNTMNNKYIFLEAKFSENGIIGVHLDNTFNKVMARDDIKSDNMTKLEKYFTKSLDTALAESYDGYFYALADENFKVMFTHYTIHRMPTFTAGESLSDFRDDLMVGADGKLKGSADVLGTCSDDYIIAANGTYAFNMPDSTDSKYSMYLG